MDIFSQNLLERYKSAYLDENSEVHIDDPAEHKFYLLEQGFTSEEAEQIIADATLLGSYFKKESSYE